MGEDDDGECQMNGKGGWEAKDSSNGVSKWGKSRKRRSRVILTRNHVKVPRKMEADERKKCLRESQVDDKSV